MLAANGAQIAVKSSFYNDTKRVDIPGGVSPWTWNAVAPATQSSDTITVSAYDHFCGVFVSASASFTIGQSSLPPPQASSPPGQPSLPPGPPSSPPGLSPQPTPTASQLPSSPPPPPPLPPPGQSSLPPPPPPPPTSPPTSQLTPPPSNFPNAQPGTILWISQETSTDISMEVAFDNFAAYMAQFQDHDCFNDGNEYHELYNADTGDLVVSSPRGAGGGIGYCGTFFQTTGNNWLHFLPIALPAGNYWVRYHGTKVGDPAGYDWVTGNFSYTPIQPSPAGKAPNLIVIVHGCCTDANDVIKDWESFGRRIAGTIQPPGTWEIVVLDWHQHTPKDAAFWSLANAISAYGNTENYRIPLAQAIAKYSYNYVHLIGHSAGAKLIQSVAEELSLIYAYSSERPFIHLTFLDAFTPFITDWLGYGSLGDYPHYSEHYVDTNIFIPFTRACLPNSFNFDISGWEHSPEEDGLLGHHWPIYWYQKSVAIPNPVPKFSRYGYPLSFEGGNGNYKALSGGFPKGIQCSLSEGNPNCEAAVCWAGY